MTLGDRVAIMEGGVFQQVAPPMEVYRRPANRFVASFIGSPAMNFFEGRIRRTADGRPLFEAGSLQVPLPRDMRGTEPAERVTLGVRPHDIRIDRPDEGDVPARIDVVEPMGADTLVHVRLGVEEGGAEARVITPAEAPASEGDTVGLHLNRDRLHLFGADVDGARLN